MKNNKTKLEKFLWFVESYGPFICGIASAIFMGYILPKFVICNYESFEKILDSTITFSSITVGFVGVLLGILFSIRNTDVIKLLFAGKEEKRILKKYFKNNITSGLLLVIISIILYTHQIINNFVLISLFGIWGFLLAYTLASSYRIINIMTHIIFDNNELNYNKKPEALSMDEDSKRLLKGKYRKI